MDGGGEEGGADFSVGRAEEAAEGTGESVNGPEADVGEGDAAEEGGIAHVCACGGVLAVVIGGVEGGGEVGEATAAEGIGEGMSAMGDEGFEKLGERVEAGGGGDGGGDGEREEGVDDDGVGDHVGVAEADF